MSTPTLSTDCYCVWNFAGEPVEDLSDWRKVLYRRPRCVVLGSGKCCTQCRTVARNAVWGRGRNVSHCGRKGLLYRGQDVSYRDPCTADDWDQKCCTGDKMCHTVNWKVYSRTLLGTIICYAECVVLGPEMPYQWTECVTLRSEGGRLVSYWDRRWALQWRHNERDDISNHQPHDCLLDLIFRRRSKKISKLRVTGLSGVNSPVTGEFPAQKGQ